jgi:hypothetical protein
LNGKPSAFDTLTRFCITTPLKEVTLKFRLNNTIAAKRIIGNCSYEKLPLLRRNFPH